jgi:hypothetical protein
MLHTDGYLDIESAGNQPVSIALFDMSGRVINKLSTSVMTGKNCIHFDAMMITPGMYNLYVQTSDGVKATLRFMKD